jgi:periplasmic divalent cation tolerance protein
MTDKIVVLVTVGGMREGKRIARRLLDKQLIACANLVPLVRSVYRWQGKVKEDRECLMLLKSSRELFAKLQHEVQTLHSYSVPEIIALPIIEGSPNYLNWIAESVAHREPPGVSA